MTDLTAGEHIVDALEIDARKYLYDSIDFREQIDNLWSVIANHSPRYYNAPTIVRHLTEGHYFDGVDPNKWYLNGQPIRQLTESDVMKLIYKLEPCAEKLESTLIARHPSSERFHSLLPNVAEMAYRIDNELYPEGATAWGVDAWIVPMRQMERVLRYLHAVARGDRTAKAPSTLMMEVSALAMVARKYYTDDYATNWANTYTASMGETHDRKMADYGRDDDPFANVRASEDWSVEPWVGAFIRLTDKVRRLQSFAIKGVLMNESALDSIIDISVYSLIGRVLYEQSRD